MSLNELSPKIKDLVVWLNSQGFTTTDSGDGSNFDNGMGCAVPYPMVAMEIHSHSIVEITHRLYELLVGKGVKFDVCDPSKSYGPPTIEASYSPVDRVAVIVLTNILSADLKLS
jgi:hypothetical protein